MREEIRQLRNKQKDNLAKRRDAFVYGGDGWHDNFSFENLEMEYHYLTSRIEELRKELRGGLNSPSQSSGKQVV